jgi:hypothetical protein
MLEPWCLKEDFPQLMRTVSVGALAAGPVSPPRISAEGAPYFVFTNAERPLLFGSTPQQRQLDVVWRSRRLRCHRLSEAPRQAPPACHHRDMLNRDFADDTLPLKMRNVCVAAFAFQS